MHNGNGWDLKQSGWIPNPSLASVLDLDRSASINLSWASSLSIKRGVDCAQKVGGTELLIALRSPYPRAELIPVSSELPGKSDSDCRAGFRVDITSTRTLQGGLPTTDRPRLLSRLQWRNCRFIASWNDFGPCASLPHHSDHCITVLCLRPGLQGFNYTCAIPLTTVLRFNMISNYEKGKRILREF